MKLFQFGTFSRLMDFFKSLPKLEQTVLSNIVMTYSGPSQIDLAIGCLAASLMRNADLNKPIDAEEDFDEYGNTMLTSGWYQRDQKTYNLRTQEIVIGTYQSDDEKEQPRWTIKVEVRKHRTGGGITWETAASAAIEPSIENAFPATPADREQAYWTVASRLLPKLEAMIKCCGCGTDIINRVNIVQPNGQTFLSNHCESCSQRTWTKPCTHCGAHIGDRDYKTPWAQGASWAENSARQQEDFCSACKKT